MSGRGLIADFGPLRRSRQFRQLMLGILVTGTGTQMTMLALPYQIYIETDSALLTGLIGAAELVPMVVMSLLGGGLVDRYDRRAVLFVDQLMMASIAAALGVISVVSSKPHVGLLLALAGAMAGVWALQNVCRQAIIPNIVDRADLAPALALFTATSRLTTIIGPAVGGVLIAVLGVQSAYFAHAISCSALIVAVVQLGSQRPERTTQSAVRLIGDGLRFVKRNQWLTGSLALDLIATTFAMPRVLFPVLSVSVFHAGATGAGLLNTAVAIGATASAIFTGWVSRTYRLGRVLIAAVFGWGLAVMLAGLAPTLWLAMLLFAIAGAADSVSAVCRSTISHSVTPDHMRGRMSSLYSLSVTGGPRLGAMTSGGVAAGIGAASTVVFGGLTCMAAVALLAFKIPAIVRYDTRDWLGGHPDDIAAGNPSR